MKKLQNRWLANVVVFYIKWYLPGVVVTAYAGAVLNPKPTTGCGGGVAPNCANDCCFISLIDGFGGCVLKTGRATG